MRKGFAFADREIMSPFEISSSSSGPFPFPGKKVQQRPTVCTVDPGKVRLPSLSG